MTSKKDIILLTDTETLGLTPGYHRVIEISYARIVDNDWGSFKIITHRLKPRDEDFVKAHPRALEVNGYRDGHPEWVGAPEIQTLVAAEIWREVLTAARDARLMCQNVPFDRSMIWEELRLHGVYDVPVGVGPLDGPWDKAFIETRPYAKQIAKYLGFSSGSLNPVYEQCVQHLGAPPVPQAHRSESDVLRTAWVWAHAAELCNDNTVPSADVKRAVERWIARTGPAMATIPETIPEPSPEMGYNLTPQLDRALLDTLLPPKPTACATGVEGLPDGTPI